MNLYLESYTIRVAVYGSIEDGYTRLTIDRARLPDGPPPEKMYLDVWMEYA